MRRVCISFSMAALMLWAISLNDVKPAPWQAAWQDLELGALLHYGVDTFTDQEGSDRPGDPGVFQPADLNAEQWVTVAKSAGARYVMLQARNADGFCLWPSEHSAYSVKATPWRNGQGDLVREVANACRKHDLKFGLALNGASREQQTELASSYGDLVEIWHDGSADGLRALQPNALISGGDLRRITHERGHGPEENWHALGERWLPGEAVLPLREKHWFWHPHAEPRIMPMEKLLETYHRSVGRGYQLVLGLTPDRRGLIPEADVVRLKEFGDQVKRLYAQNLVSLATFWNVDGGPSPRAAFDGDRRTFWMAGADRRSATITLAYKTPVTFDRVLMMEWLNDGQKIYRYQIEAKHRGQWSTLVEGTTIGHKRIDRFPIQTASEFRVTLNSMSGPPALREFQIHNGGGL